MLLIILALFILPDSVYAWGPLTHAYLSHQIFNLSNLLTLSALPIIKNYRDYFIYGNILPDTVIGKKYLPQEKNPHSWKTGLNLLNKAKTPEEKSFAYGYLTHLAADASLHYEIKNFNPIQHMIFELKADRIVDRIYWIQIMTINRRVINLSERFFEQTLMNPIASFKTSKKIYKSLIFLSAFNMGEIRNPSFFKEFHVKSITAMLDVLKNGERAEIINLSPNN